MVEVAELRQKLQTMETLEKELEIHRQKMETKNMTSTSKKRRKRKNSMMEMEVVEETPSFPEQHGTKNHSPQLRISLRVLQRQSSGYVWEWISGTPPPKHEPHMKFFHGVGAAAQIWF
ncbi:hypothetical protein Rs2_35536 [Raphanus sativus]|nr:hypothetical protein Rs2_35536 [Raphanus sativus]